ncbi:MAG TPA: CRTAC1 family protein [Gemmataceae bacterium]|nr:CRTAC1 family protein [Gemmataceae bacterium]
MQAFKQALMVVLLAGLIGTVAVLGKPTSGGPGTPLGNEEALNRYGFYLREVSHECGINFTHQAPTLDPKLEHIMPIIASMGASVTVVDFDHDGWPDLYVVNSGEGSKNALYRNQHDGTFKDVAEEMGVADLNKPGTGVCMGAVWGDYDNDGYEDLLIYKWGKPELYHNDHGKGFTRVTDKAGLPKWVNANSAIWLDYDGDGQLDLLICGYWREDIDLWHLDTTKIMPNDFEYATNGGRKYLLRNRGDGTFEDVTEKVGLTSRSWTLAVAAAHLCGSRYPDIFLANDYGVSELYANQDGTKFVELGKQSGIRAPKSGMNVSFGDIYNQGCFSAYISNITEPGQLIQGNNLWVMEKPNAGSDIHFMNEANSLGVEQGGWSWGAQFGDLNNDGQLDLYLTNGYISTDNPESYWFDYSQIAGAFKGIIEDAKNWPAMKGRQLSGHQQKHVWVNRGGKFIEVAQAVGVTDTYDGRSVALVDLLNRGVLDVVVANQKGPLLVYKNTVKPGHEWIQVELEGTRSNRSAIGAQVRLYWNGQQQLQEVSGGDGYASQNMRRLHFGLGENPHLEKAVIQWPSGQEQTLTDLKPGQLYPVKEPK